MQDVVFVQNIAFCANFAKFCFCANYFAQYCSKLVAYDAEYCAKLGPPPCTNYAQNFATVFLREIAQILRKKCHFGKTLAYSPKLDFKVKLRWSF